MSDVLDRLGRRGVLTVTVIDGTYDVRFKSPGPYGNLGWCTTDMADLFEHCRLGAKNWHGEGPDLDTLIVDCEDATRPQRRDVDELRWTIEYRRDSRTYGPPLPTFMRWAGWRPGEERWLRTSSHATEYLAGYLHYDLGGERKFNAERAAAELSKRRHRIASGQ